MHNQNFIQSVFCQVFCCPNWAAAPDCGVCELQKDTAGAEVKPSFHLEQGFIQLEEAALSSHMVRTASRLCRLISLEGVPCLIPLKIPTRQPQPGMEQLSELMSFCKKPDEGNICFGESHIHNGHLWSGGWKQADILN